MAPGFPLVVNGISIRTSEALYQACRFPHMPEAQKLILLQTSPMTAKMKSKPYRNQSRSDWDDIRVKVMRWCLRVKLAQNWNAFSSLLLDTGDREIVENSHKDNFWGAIPTDEECLVGMNGLGRLLTDLREKIKYDDPSSFNCVVPPDIPNFLLYGYPIEEVLLRSEVGRTAKNRELFVEDDLDQQHNASEDLEKLITTHTQLIERDPNKVHKELDKRLRENLRKAGDFSRIHPFPQSSQDVPDDLDARLVVLGIDHPYSKVAGNLAEVAAKNILENRGSSPRLYPNTLVFLAPDKTRLQVLDDATRCFLAWDSILNEKLQLNLYPEQVKQAETQKAAADGAVTAHLSKTYQWLLVPVQATPTTPIKWQATKVSGQGPLAMRVTKKLRSDELLLTGFAATRLRRELDRIPLWRGNHVAVKQLAEDFARYLYLPRLQNTSVLLEAIRSGCAMLTWEQDSFGFADSHDELASRYRGLRCGQNVALLDSDAPGILVKPDIARRQLDAEDAPVTLSDIPIGNGSGEIIETTGGGTGLVSPATHSRNASALQMLLWDGEFGQHPRRTRCRPNRRRGHLAPHCARWSRRHHNAGDKRQYPRRST